MDSVQKANETSCGFEVFFSDSTQLTPAQLSAFNKGQPARIINRHPPDLQHHRVVFAGTLFVPEICPTNLQVM